MLISEAIEQYKYAILRLSPATQEWYIKRLDRFSSWCAEHGLTLDTLKPLETRKYTEFLRITPSEKTGLLLSSYTVHGHVRAIRTFLRWCNQEEGLEGLVSAKTTKLDMPKVDKVIIETITAEDIEKLLRACSKEIHPELQVRDKAIVSLLVETGIRAGELCGLTLDCVFLSAHNAFIRVFGKGRKEREVGVGSQASKALHLYIHRHRKSHPGENHVFLSRSHDPLTISGLDQMLYRLGDWAMVEGVHAHKFRHTFAVNYLTQGGDLFDLARLMGHSTTEVTRLYLETYSSTQARKKGISVLDSMKGAKR